MGEPAAVAEAKIGGIEADCRQRASMLYWRGSRDMPLWGVMAVKTAMPAESTGRPEGRPLIRMGRRRNCALLALLTTRQVDILLEKLCREVC